MTPKKKRSREQTNNTIANNDTNNVDNQKELTVEQVVSPTKKSKKSKKIKGVEENNERHCTVKEIVSTERIYVENLYNTINVCSIFFFDFHIPK